MGYSLQKTEVQHNMLLLLPPGIQIGVQDAKAGWEAMFCWRMRRCLAPEHAARAVQLWAGCIQAASYAPANMCAGTETDLSQKWQ